MPYDRGIRSQTRIARLAAYAPALRGPADTWIETTPPRGSGTSSDPYVMGSGVPHLTQAALASMAGLTRQKIIAAEKGSLSVAMMAYARILGALDCEFALVPAARPTLEEIQEVFD